MKKQNIKKIIMVSLFIITILLLGSNVVYAATTSELNFCDYAGSRRAFKIGGIILNIAKIVVPLLIVILGMIAFVKPMMSGKVDDLKESAMKLFKQCIAGLVIFFIPSILDFCFGLIPDYDDSPVAECTTCLFDPDGCVIPDKDPETYTETKQN